MCTNHMNISTIQKLTLKNVLPLLEMQTAQCQITEGISFQNHRVERQTKSLHQALWKPCYYLT